MDTGHRYAIGGSTAAARPVMHDVTPERDAWPVAADSRVATILWVPETSRTGADLVLRGRRWRGMIPRWR